MRHLANRRENIIERNEAEIELSDRQSSNKEQKKGDDDVKTSNSKRIGSSEIFKALKIASTLSTQLKNFRSSANATFAIR